MNIEPQASRTAIEMKLDDGSMLTIYKIKLRAVAADGGRTFDFVPGPIVDRYGAPLSAVSREVRVPKAMAAFDEWLVKHPEVSAV